MHFVIHALFDAKNNNNNNKNSKAQKKKKKKETKGIRIFSDISDSL